ncbi:MAG: hypothetical protein ACJAV1_002659 [Paraglaciecola sp.]|jgi:hypothetical protein
MTNLFIPLALIILSGCDSDSNDDSHSNSYSKKAIHPALNLKYGVVSNSCGPSDAAVINIRLTDEVIDCATDIRNVSNISSHLALSNTQDITVGMMLAPHSYASSGPMDANECNVGFDNCVAVGQLSIKVTSQQGDAFEGNSLEGVYFIDNNGSTTQGGFVIKRCNNKRPRCG